MCITKHKPGSYPGSVMLLASLVRIQQYAFDHLRVDVVGFHIFDRAYRIETRLHDDATFNDCAALLVVSLLMEVGSGNGFQAGR